MTIFVTSFIDFMEEEIFGNSSLFSQTKLFLPSLMKDIFTGYQIMDWQFFPLAF